VSVVQERGAHRQPGELKGLDGRRGQKEQVESQSIYGPSASQDAWEGIGNDQSQTISDSRTAPDT
jgi:hypothetical protein